MRKGTRSRRRRRRMRRIKQSKIQQISFPSVLSLILSLFPFLLFSIASLSTSVQQDEKVLYYLLWHFHIPLVGWGFVKRITFCECVTEHTSLWILGITLHRIIHNICSLSTAPCNESVSFEKQLGLLMIPVCISRKPLKFRDFLPPPRIECGTSVWSAVRCRSN